MAANYSMSREHLLRLQFKFIILQLLVKIFLVINFLLTITFFQKEYFYTTARYILFAVTLVSDIFLLALSDVLIIFTVLFVHIQIWMCILINAVVLVCVTLTPVTLAAMTLERYVAICMPLRHGELSSTRNTVHCVLIIHGISSVPCIVIFSSLFATAPSGFYTQVHICHEGVFMLYKWQQNLRSAIYQSLFLFMSIIIVFSYTKIMKVAKAASGEDKKSSKKGLRTVTLHGFQLLLCLIQMWCPFIEDALFLIDNYLFETIRYFNYIIFYLAPRCLSPLIYGVRDEAFCKALKHNASFGIFKRNMT